MNIQAVNFVDKLKEDFVFEIGNVEQKAEIMFGPKPGFTLIEIDAKCHQNKVPGAVFISGDAVAIFVVLKAENNRYVVLTSQPRLPTGKSDFIEIPAGMLDNEGNIKSKALAELEEETHLKVDTDNLIELGSFYTSPGRSDEKIWLYSLEIDVDKDMIKDMQNKRTGNKEENEHIFLKLILLNDVYNFIKEDAKSLIGYFEYMKNHSMT